ncbi:unnamed protein product, partial [Tetraodon nigroviridis]
TMDPSALLPRRRHVRKHKRARAHPYKQTPAHRNAQDLHRGNLHQWPKQPFPVAPKHFPIPAQPLYMPGMPPGLAYNTGGHLGFMHHPYMNGIPNVLQFGVPVANHFNPGCYMPAVWWNQQMPVNPFPYGPINFYQPRNLGFQPTGVPAGGPSQRVSSVSHHLNVPTGPTEDSPRAVIEDPFTELEEMLLLVCALENQAQANAF